VSTIQFRTDPISLAVFAGVPVRIEHNIGRPPNGWLVVWSSEFVQFRVADVAADSRKVLTLVADTTCDVRLVLV
jgi:hypothetical protein